VKEIYGLIFKACENNGDLSVHWKVQNRYLVKSGVWYSEIILIRVSSNLCVGHQF